MLKAAERECLLKFLGYNDREFLSACRDAGVRADTIKNKVRTHKTQENKYRPRPLTYREECALSSLLRQLGDAFMSWCVAYEVDRCQLESAIKRMVKNG
ncbi:TPA: hypothetical protein ACQ8UR_003895 [Escherichia coli]|uniref:hypothetical protein n=1 Tax=Escherichia coli TaxID=562 RepID=UPI000A186DA3|nr:hypothetical protein [Escherichia coli]OSK33769.1 hypothetical protein EAHG_05009 [Escherichia coli B671]